MPVNCPQGLAFVVQQHIPAVSFYVSQSLHACLIQFVKLKERHDKLKTLLRQQDRWANLIIIICNITSSQLLHIHNKSKISTALNFGVKSFLGTQSCKLVYISISVCQLHTCGLTIITNPVRLLPSGWYGLFTCSTGN